MIRLSDRKRLSFPAHVVLVILTVLALVFGVLTSVDARSIQESASQTATYIVVLKDEPLARYSGGIAGYAATSLQATASTSAKRKATGARKLNVRSAESVSYLSYLAGQRGVAINSASNSIGRDLDISYEYGATIVGFAAEMTAEEAERVATLGQVAFVELEKISYLHTDAGPVWSGAAGVWGGDWSALSYKATLSGAHEVPPVSSTLSGTAEFTYNFHTNDLSYTIEVENPGGVNLVAMHIHKAAAGTNGGVIHNLGLEATSTGFTATGSVTLSGPDEAALVNGQLYLNVHSTLNPGGEVRGQIELDGTLGEGIIVGIIDTGIDPWNPSFLATGGDGYVHTNPKGAGNYVGVCDPANTGDVYDASFTCNEKLIGAWSYPSIGPTARDSDGHGSHTGGTAAGNIVFDAAVEAPTETFTADISGVAPHANIIAYAACCSGAALAAARDQALLDGVDVINYSIGSTYPTGDFWEDSEAIQWLALRDAGVFVATSNGNAGNGDATTGSPADLPWLTSVGASSHNRSFLVTLTLSDSTNSSITVSGQAMTNGYGPAEVVFSSSITNTLDTRLCAPGAFAPGTFNGEIVICQRGEYSRVEKGQSVLDGGAGGYILVQTNEENGGPGAVAADTHVLPAIHIDYYEYQNLLQFMLVDSVGSVTGVLSGASLALENTYGDIMASFSSRGPNGSDADLIVPNVTAPGRAIMAAYHQGDAGDGDYTYNVIQGTSMSSPHVAGAAALLSALHPDWTPAEMQSALMMTARDSVLDDDALMVATPFAQGSGHINVHLAAESSLIMDVSKAQYDAADPDVENGFGLRDLNIPSLGNDQCAGSCSWTRTVENATDETLTWTVSLDGPAGFAAIISPSVFTLGAGESQEIEIRLNVSSATFEGEWQFGSFDFDETSGHYPDAHWSFAVIPSVSNIPETLDIETRTTTGSVDMLDLASKDISEFHAEVTGLTKAARHGFTLTEDNNTGADFPDIFFDDPATTRFVPITVPADSFSVIADIVETSSPDLDMLLFLDADANGPDLGDVGDPAENPDACQSASGGSDEFCEILSPTAGTYYVAIINFWQVTDGGDPVDLATAVTADNGADEGNLTVNGPATVSDGSPYAITVSYDEAGMTAIDKLYGYFTIGSDPGNPGNIATVRVSLEYLGTPDIDINPTALAATVEQQASLTQTLSISSSGGVMDWNIVTPGSAETLCKGVGDIEWLDASPSSGTLSPGQTDLAVTYDAADLAVGIYTDNLCVSSNDPDEPVLSVPVTMTVVVVDGFFSDGFED